MSFDKESAAAFLLELYRVTEGAADRQASMHGVGEAIGMEKDAASDFAQTLMLEDLVELRTLAGDISLTDKGLEILRERGEVESAVKPPRLSGNEALTVQDRELVDSLLSEIRAAVIGSQADYRQIEEVVFDIKTIEVQLLGGRAKTAVIVAVLQALHRSLLRLEKDELAGKTAALMPAPP